MAYAVRRPVENLYLVRERDRQRTRELVVLALAAVPPAVVLFLAIWANLETVRLGYQLAGVAKNREALLERRQGLEMDRAQAAALARVELIARGTLGMVPPTLDQVVLVRDAALAGPAAPAPAVPRATPPPPGPPSAAPGKAAP